MSVPCSPGGRRVVSVETVSSSGPRGRLRQTAASVAASAVSASWAAATTSATAAAASVSASSSSLETRVGVGRGTWTRRRLGLGGAARGRISARAMSRASTRMRGSQGMRRPGLDWFFWLGFGGIIIIPRGLPSGGGSQSWGGFAL